MKNIDFKKRFGQNFIHDKRVVEKIVDLADIDRDTFVIEIGPGSGVMTRLLVNKAKYVLAFEIDTDLKEYLVFKEDNIDVEFVDFLNVDLVDYVSLRNYKKLKVVANLPYYITGAILNKLLMSDVLIDEIVIMVQKEVAERITSPTGKRSYGSLTAFVNYFYHATNVLEVGPEVFIPRPNVDSMVVKMIRKENRVVAFDEEKLFKLIRDSFQFKRKTIKNNLRNYDLAIIEKILIKNNMSLSVRAESIGIDIFVELANELFK